MFANNPEMRNPNGGHQVGIVIPYQGEADDRWVDFAGHRLAEHFGNLEVIFGLAGWENDAGAHTGPVIILRSETPVLRDLDYTILYGIGLQVFWALRRSGIAVIVDDDLIMLS